MKGLSTANILRTARELKVSAGGCAKCADGASKYLRKRELLAAVAAEPSPPVVLPDLCVVALKYVRLERELAEVQRELNRLQDTGR